MSKIYPHTHSRLVCMLALLGMPLPLAFTGTTNAATLFWDGTDTTANADGGNGTWDTTNTNWDSAATGGANATWNNATPDSATFGGTAGTVTLGTAILVNNMDFNTDGYVIDLGGNTLTNSVNGTFITSSGGADVTIQNGTVSLSQPDGVSNISPSSGSLITFANDALVTGSGGIRMDVGGGAGTRVILNNTANNFTGDLRTTFSATYEVASIADSGVASAAGAGSKVILGNNGGLLYNGSSDSTNRTLELVRGGTNSITLVSGSSLTWNGTVDNQGTSNKTVRVSGDNNTSFELTSALADGASSVTSFNFAGGGSNNLTKLSGNNTFTGNISGANQARLIIDGAGTLGWNGSEGDYAGAINLAQSSRIQYESSADQTLSGVISSVSQNNLNGIDFTVDGTGTLTMTGTNTYTGTTIVDSGTLLINGDNSAANNSYTVNGGTLGGTGTVGGDTTIASGAFLSAGDAGVGTLNFGMTVDISGISTGALLFDLQGATTDVVSLGADGTDILTIGSGLLNFDDFTFTDLGGLIGDTYTIFDTNNSINGTLGSSLDGFINGLAATISLSGDGQDILLTVVPEPSSTALLGLGLSSLLLRRKRS